MIYVILLRYYQSGLEELLPSFADPFCWDCGLSLAGKSYRIRDNMVDDQLLHEAQEILLRCDAISYGMYQIENRYDAATQLLDQLNLKNKNPLIKAFDELVHPMGRLTKGVSEEG